MSKVCKGLEEKLVPVLTEWAWVAVLNLFSRFRRRYNRQVVYDHRVFNVRGLLTRGTYALEVEKVFVELRIAPGHLQHAGVNPVGFKAVQGSQPVWEFLRRMKCEDPAALAIIGPPGSGKTTLLQHIALILAANKQGRFRFRPYTPLFLFLRDAARLMREGIPNLAIGFLEYTYEGLLLPKRIERPWWRRLLRLWKKDWEIEKSKQDVLDAYWFLRMVRMRESGDMPAWEGIRLVREDKEYSP